MITGGMPSVLPGLVGQINCYSYNFKEYPHEKVSDRSFPMLLVCSAASPGLTERRLASVTASERP